MYKLASVKHYYCRKLDNNGHNDYLITYKTK